MGRSKLVQFLKNVYTCTEILLICTGGTANIDYRCHPADADSPKSQVLRLGKTLILTTCDFAGPKLYVECPICGKLFFALSPFNK